MRSKTRSTTYAPSCDERNAGEWEVRTVQALKAEFERRYEALATRIERYDAVMEDWLDTLPERPKHIGIRVGPRWYISAREVATLAGTSVDAARKYMAAHVKEFYPFGRLKYWDLDEVREAVRRREDAEEARSPRSPRRPQLRCRARAGGGPVARRRIRGRSRRPSWGSRGGIVREDPAARLAGLLGVWATS